MDNIRLGAIGIVVIHNPLDTQGDFLITDADLPDGNPNGSPIGVRCFPFPGPIGFDKTLLQDLGKIDPDTLSVLGNPGVHHHMDASKDKNKGKANSTKHEPAGESFLADPKLLIQRGDLLLHLNKDLTTIRGFCFRNYKAPPSKAQYLQLFHELTNAPGMCINGRTYLGNTPSLVAGVNTRMRFGVVGMGGTAGIHTFHIHGHRWVVPGPHGNTPATIQGSILDTPVSQFEDTRIFGPANSFVFFIDGASGSFMRAGGRLPDQAKGEWHMHCHVLDHMMQGMMGSLLIVGAGDAVSLPHGEPCPQGNVTPPPPNSVHLTAGFAFSPQHLTVPAGTSVVFHKDTATDHSIIWDMPTPMGTPTPPNSPLATPASPIHPMPQDFTVTMTNVGTFPYYCGYHGSGDGNGNVSGMSGTITVT
jgi:plastocyanin